MNFISNVFNRKLNATLGILGISVLKRSKYDKSSITEHLKNEIMIR